MGQLPPFLCEGNVGNAPVIGGGPLAKKSFAFHLLHCPGNARAGDVQRLADVGDLYRLPLLLQCLDGIQKMNVLRSNPFRQFREKIPNPLGLIARIQQGLDCFDVHFIPPI